MGSVYSVGSETALGFRQMMEKTEQNCYFQHAIFSKTETDPAEILANLLQSA